MSLEFMKTEPRPPFLWHSVLTDTCKSQPAMAWRSKSVRDTGIQQSERVTVKGKGSDGKRGRVGRGKTGVVTKEKTETDTVQDDKVYIKGFFPQRSVLASVKMDVLLVQSRVLFFLVWKVTHYVANLKQIWIFFFFFTWPMAWESNYSLSQSSTFGQLLAFWSWLRASAQLIRSWVIDATFKWHVLALIWLVL